MEMELECLRQGTFLFGLLYIPIPSPKPQLEWQLPTLSRSRRLPKLNARHPAKMAFHQN